MCLTKQPGHSIPLLQSHMVISLTNPFAQDILFLFSPVGLTSDASLLATQHCWCQPCVCCLYWNAFASKLLPNMFICLQCQHMSDSSTCTGSIR